MSSRGKETNSIHNEVSTSQFIDFLLSHFFYFIFSYLFFIENFNTKKLLYISRDMRLTRRKMHWLRYWDRDHKKN
jgi:hypothetical protein